ncbi:hypothetical protein OH686_19000 [Pseudomonas sp. SO81]|nr:hypothetical protein OH686_19000 [Pseudomonas sp. SO81]
MLWATGIGAGRSAKARDFIRLARQRPPGATVARGQAAV